MEKINRKGNQMEKKEIKKILEAKKEIIENLWRSL